MNSVLLDLGPVAPVSSANLAEADRVELSLILLAILGWAYGTVLGCVRRTTGDAFRPELRHVVLHGEMESQKWLYCIGRIRALILPVSYGVLRAYGVHFGLCWKNLPSHQMQTSHYQPITLLDSHWRRACDCTTLYVCDEGCLQCKPAGCSCNGAVQLWRPMG